MSTKADLHQLIDRLPDGDIDAAVRLLADPFLLALLSTPEGETPLDPDQTPGCWKPSERWLRGEDGASAG